MMKKMKWGRIEVMETIVLVVPKKCQSCIYYSVIDDDDYIRLYRCEKSWDMVNYGHCDDFKEYLSDADVVNRGVLE